MTPKKRSAGRPTAPGTARALAMIDAGKANPHAAALACRIDPSTVYRALARRRERAALKCTAADAPQPDGQDPGEALESTAAAADQVKGSE